MVKDISGTEKKIINKQIKKIKNNNKKNKKNVEGVKDHLNI